MEQNFKENLKKHQQDLINEGFFDGTTGGGVFRGIKYSHILMDEWNNLYPTIKDNVKTYFEKNNISFWGGKTITGNTLSSQVSCLNHLFLIRDDEEAVKSVIQALVGDRMSIETMIKVESKKEVYNPQYIAFEMVSDVDRLNEGKLTRGNTCTSIDAFAIAQDKSGGKRMIIIEWKLVEDDSGNKAPSEETSKNNEEIARGKKRVKSYGELIQKSEVLNEDVKRESFFNTSLFHLPFYELMRQTLWAENNKADFAVDDYLHVTVIPQRNPMRSKNYKCVENTHGIVEAWKKHLTEYGKDRYIDADSEQVVKALQHFGKYSNIVDYLQKRYYSLS